jgi:hypothetical protein
MRKSLSFLLVLLCAFLLHSCKKGPAGPEGPQGPQGLQGATGSPNVIYSNWIEGKSLKWADTTYSRILYSRANIFTTSLNQSMLDHGLILMYLKSGDYNLLLPILIYDFPNGSSFGSYFFNLGPGRITVLATYFNSKAFIPIPLDAPGYFFRYILVPGGLLGGRMTGGSSTSRDDITKMTYEQVVKLFGIPDKGSNEVLVK